MSGDVTAAVERDLERIRTRDPHLAESALAATALQLAREMDAKNSATSKSYCAKALLETLDRLRELAPAERERDGVDELQAARRRRRTTPEADRLDA